MGLKVYPQFVDRFLNIKGGCLFVQHHDAHPQAPATPFDVMFVDLLGSPVNLPTTAFLVTSIDLLGSLSNESNAFFDFFL